MPNGEQGMAAGGGGERGRTLPRTTTRGYVISLEKILASKQKTVNQKLLLTMLIRLVGD